ncbi:hypothetical protein [Dietzia sp. PP-33]|jgi:hypothetical protein|uniref:hypothetical protein n=1 Tax=Dietzia sp. PP-33 TaxID=2957500 RepID=UPI0029B2163A|nr:hypothetical protein [Dietzia sp. PP-33]MDX2358566.1 hypothetical protein [Dietzia sp. PP-33]
MNNYVIRGDGETTLVGWGAIANEQRSRIVRHEISIAQGNEAVTVDVDQVEELITALRFGVQLARELKMDDPNVLS